MDGMTLVTKGIIDPHGIQILTKGHVYGVLPVYDSMGELFATIKKTPAIQTRMHKILDININIEKINSLTVIPDKLIILNIIEPEKIMVLKVKPEKINELRSIMEIIE